MIRASLLVLLLVTLIVGGLYVGPLIQANKGYVLISWDQYTIEMTAISLLLLLIISFFMLWAGKRLLGWTLALFSGSLSWFSHFGSRKRHLAWQSGLIALEMRDYESAKQQLIKAQGGDFDGLELIALARAEYALQDYDNAIRHYEQACQLKTVRVAATCKLGEHYLANAQHSRVIPLIESLPEKEQTASPVIQLYAQTLMEQERWTVLDEKLAEWKKLLPKQKWQALQLQSAHGVYAEIAGNDGAFQLKQTWGKQPRKVRKDPVHQAAYVKQLLQQSVFQEAEQALIGFQKKNPVTELLPLFKELRLPNPTASLKLVESWIKRDPQSPELLSTLGHLASQGKDFKLAEQTLQKALTMRTNKDDLLLLAHVKEHQADQAGALQLYKQCTLM